ncbi:PE domain-containing protein [Jatrophihabitans sp. DSM 45814]
MSTISVDPAALAEASCQIRDIVARLEALTAARTVASLVHCVPGSATSQVLDRLSNEIACSLRQAGHEVQSTAATLGTSSRWYQFVDDLRGAPSTDRRPSGAAQPAVERSGSGW